MVEIILVQKTDVKILNRSCIHLPKRGFAPTVPLYEIVNAILYKLKTGVQWEYLPTASLFSQKVLSWQSVYHHYRKWCRSGAFMDCWVAILKRYRGMFDLSSFDLDGSHTPAIKGGEAVEYQGRKKTRTTNALFLTDRQGLPLAMSEPVSGNHNDLFDIEVQFEVVFAILEEAGMPTDGLFVKGCRVRFRRLQVGLRKKGVIPNVPYNQRKRGCGQGRTVR